MSTSSVSVCAEAPLMPQLGKVCNSTTFGTVSTLYLDAVLKLNGSSIQSRGVRITASEEIVVYGVNKEIVSSDAYLAFPVDALGMDYFSMHAVPDFMIPDMAEFAVVASQDNTLVDVQVSSLPGVNISFQGTFYGRNSSMQVTLNKYQVLQLRSLNDMTGTRVSSSKPVAFISGNQKTCLGYAGLLSCSGDHLTEMIPPTSSWGKSFLVVPLQGRTGGDIVRIIAATDNTTVTIQQTPAVNFTTYSVTLGRGEFREFDLPSAATHYITATSPVAVYQFCKSLIVDNAQTDPFMIYIPAVNQLLSLYTFTTIEAATTTPYIHHVNLFINGTDAPGLRLDGQPLNPSNYTQLGAAGGNVGIQLTISPGTHQLSHMNDVTFGAFMYGQTRKESYGFPAGLKVILDAPEVSDSAQDMTYIALAMGTLLGGLAVLLGALVFAAGCCCCGGAATRRRKRKKEKEDEEYSRLEEDTKRKKEDIKEKRKHAKKSYNAKVADISPPATANTVHVSVTPYV